MHLRIHTMVLGYQKRFWWQLSSILQQIPWTGPDRTTHPVPRISVVASVTERDPYPEWTARLRDTFSEWLQFDTWPADDETFGRRGHIRSRNIQQCPEDVDWILFNDGDMVYHPEFFANLRCIARGYENESRVLATYRDSMSFEDGYKFVRAADYEEPIPGAWKRASSVKTWPAARHRISGAGFFQLVNMNVLRRRIRDENPDLQYYVDPSYNKDHNTFEQNHITRSDRNFRLRLGGIVPIHCLPQIHLNHYRKNDPEYPEEVH